jgi:hypothetical protein
VPFRAGLVALLLAVPATALAGHDPLAQAAGTWRGQAYNGDEKFSVTATVRKSGSILFLSLTARPLPSGKPFKASAVAKPERENRLVTVRLDHGVIEEFQLKMTAVPVSGTELAVYSIIGDGELDFKMDFMKAELDFRTPGPRVTAELTRIYPPPKAPAGGAAKGEGKKKAPTAPPMIAVPEN